MGQLNRRRLVLGGVALSGTAWVAPSIVALDRVAAATGSAASLIAASRGVTILDPPPPSFALNVVESDTTTHVIAESPCTILPRDIVVNRSTPGSFNGGSNELTVIPAGTAVCSFYVHPDRATNGGLQGGLEFATPILGLIYERPQFDATTPILGVPGLDYPAPNGAFAEPHDLFELSANTVTWDVRMGGVWADVMRVIVAC